MSRRAWTLTAVALGAAAVAREVALRRAAWDLNGRSALVTGGSRGLGLLVARELAREGCRVAVCARDERELERAAETLSARGAHVAAIRCDVTDPDDVARMFEHAAEVHGPVEILVNNAGTIQAGPLEAMTPEDFERAMAVNFWGTFHCTWAALPAMLARGEGRIANVTSIGGRVAVPHLLPYTTSKFAAAGLSQGLRAELARHGIRVVTIVPGLLRTGSFLNALFKGDREAEFGWFALADSLPVVSMDAERAARRIVRAARRGEADVTLGVPARLLALAAGTFPGATTDLLGMVNRVLPRVDGDRPAPGLGDARPAEPGHAVRDRVDAGALDRLLGWGLDAARRFHQHPGPATV